MKIRRKFICMLITIGLMFTFLPSVSLALEDGLNASYINENAYDLNYGRTAVTFGTDREFWFTFIPNTTGYYELFSILGDVPAEVSAFFYDSSLDLMGGTVTIGNDNRDFDILNRFEQGKKYYVRLNILSSLETGDFLIKFFPSVRYTNAETFTASSDGSAVLNCTATNSHTSHPEYYHYQWYDGSHNPISGANSSVYRPVSASGNTYYCRYWFYSEEITERKFTVTAPSVTEPSEEENNGNSEDIESPEENGETSENNGSGNSGSTTAIPEVSEPGVAGFVERLYSIALGRASDPAGKQSWVDAITLRGTSGAEAARGFLYSPEFLNRDTTNEDFTRVLYRTFFDREPDEAGFTAWVNALNDGASKQDVIEGFINSTEWANLCLRYGIASGGSGTPNTEVEPNEQTIGFATRLYTTCLNRDADENGLMAWARQLANQRDTGTGAARGFFFSSEFTGQNVSNSEYVNRLYRTFMGREADEAGFNAWVGQLDSGVSREEVFDGFAASTEFAQICASYGIIR